MTEAEAVAAKAIAPSFVSPTGGGSAGRLLRQAREAQGLPIDALAASIKVTVRKLEQLEGDRFDELPDATFTRALAQAVCRSLKIDPAPVLALLPPARGHRIEQVSEGLNAPFRDRSARLDALAWGSLVRAAWVGAPLLVLAALIYYLPSGWIGSTLASAGEAVQALRSSAGGNTAGSDPAVATADGGPAAADAPAPMIESAFPAIAASSPAAAPAVPKAGAGPLQLRANAESWVEVKDARDRVLMSRSLQPSETVTLEGALPMRVKIGNAAVTEVRFRGELVDIVPMTSENIAKVELK